MKLWNECWYVWPDNCSTQQNGQQEEKFDSSDTLRTNILQVIVLFLFYKCMKRYISKGKGVFVCCYCY